MFAGAWLVIWRIVYTKQASERREETIRVGISEEG
jgi:hypothetical protein